MNMNLMSIYSTPIWESNYPEFETHKDVFLNILREYKEENPSLTDIGYRSPNKIHHIPEFRNLFEYICQMGFKSCLDLDFVDVDIAVTSAWLNINDSRQCIINDHVHNEVFSGVFYLQAPEGSGDLVIQNPGLNRLWKGLSLCSEKNQYTAENIKIQPSEGNIILFPSYIPHSVGANNHDEERISISFEMIALPKGTIY